MKENDIYEKITYKQGIPYYMGMPCFLDGKKLNSKPKIDKDGFLSAYYWRDAGLWGVHDVRNLSRHLCIQRCVSLASLLV